MTGEQWTLVGVLVAAVLGTTGVSGLLTGGIEVGRRARLRRHVARALDLRDRVQRRSIEWEALTYSARLDSVRLASLSTVTLRKRLGQLVRAGLLALVMYAVIGSALVYSGVGALLFDDRGGLVLLAFLVAIATTSTLSVGVLDLSLRQDRADFVAAVMAGEDVEAATRRLTL